MQDTQVRRGEYLVNFGGCHDCHTPKQMTANGPIPNKTSLLSGYPENGKLADVPKELFGPDRWGAVTNNDLTAWVGPWGTSFAANLTPDKATGLGNWSARDFIATMRTGKHLGAGRPVLPPMPWFDIGMLNDQDLKAIFAYLHSLKPIVNKVPQPIPPQ
jgi:mono/diheme cytochrome c family protein